MIFVLASGGYLLTQTNEKRQKKVNHLRWFRNGYNLRTNTIKTTNRVTRKQPMKQTKVLAGKQRRALIGSYERGDVEAQDTEQTKRSRTKWLIKGKTHQLGKCHERNAASRAIEPG